MAQGLNTHARGQSAPSCPWRPPAGTQPGPASRGGAWLQEAIPTVNQDLLLDRTEGRTLYPSAPSSQGSKFCPRRHEHSVFQVVPIRVLGGAPSVSSVGDPQQGPGRPRAAAPSAPRARGQLKTPPEVSEQGRKKGLGPAGDGGGTRGQACYQLATSQTPQSWGGRG